MNFFLRILVLLCYLNSTAAADNFPYFSSIKSSEVNARVGPGTDYAISWVFVKKNEPIQITEAFENWRKIQDIDGPAGWIHVNMISPKRFVIVLKDEVMRYSPSDSSKIIARISSQVRCRLIKKHHQMWCKLECQNVKGWVRTPSLWGIE